MKRLIFAIMALAWSLTALAQYSTLPHFTAGPIQYGLKSADVLSMGEAVVQRLVDPNLTTVEIPYNVSRSKVNFKVEIIAEGAFAGTRLQEIRLNDDIKYILSQAFERTPLKRFRCPAKLRLIGQSAFMWCDQLEEVVTDENLKEVGHAAFWGCTKLRHFRIPRDMHTIGNNAFKGCLSLDSVVMGYDLINLGDGAFSGCVGLHHVTLAPNLRQIPFECFRGTGLNEITIGGRVETIGQSAFYGCDNLKRVVLGTNVKQLDYDAFGGTSNVETVICLATRPPQNNNAFGYATCQQGVLAVPAAAVSAYRQAPGWNRFKRIVALKQ